MAALNSTGFRELRRTAETHEASFLLQSAITASNLTNQAGLVLRGVCLLVLVAATVAAANSLSWSTLLVVPIFTGWALAAMEAHGQELIEWMSHHERGLRRLGMMYVAAREQAVISPSGVLETGIGPPLALLAFVGPWAFDTSRGWSYVGILAVIGFIGVAVSQVVSDRGYFNLEPGKVATGVIAAARWLLPAAAAVVAVLMLLLLSGGSLPVWIYVVVVALFTVSLGVAAITELMQLSALSAYRLAARSREAEIRYLASEDFHRLKVDFTAELDSTPSHKARRVLLRVRAEAETLRQHTIDAGRPEPIGGVLATAAESPHLSNLRVQATDAVRRAVLGRDEASLLRHLLLDLVANSQAVGATTIDATVTLEPDRRGWSMLVVRVTDDGPGFDVPSSMNVFRFGQSRWVLDALCRSRRGNLSYTRVGGRTTATACARVRVVGE